VGVVLLLGLAAGLVQPGLTCRRAHRPSPAAAPSSVSRGPRRRRRHLARPDGPTGNWGEARPGPPPGPIDPDRLLFPLRPDRRCPPGATVISATLHPPGRAVGRPVAAGAAVAIRLLTPWQAGTATYDTPWTTPGLAAAGITTRFPLGLTPVPDIGSLVLDVTPAVRAWLGGQPNNGMVVMMARRQPQPSHHWVMMTEQPSPTDRPTLRITYERSESRRPSSETRPAVPCGIVAAAPRGDEAGRDRDTPYLLDPAPPLLPSPAPRPLIGRSPACDLYIRRPPCLARHAEICLGRRKLHLARPGQRQRHLCQRPSPGRAPGAERRRPRSP